MAIDPAGEKRKPDPLGSTRVLTADSVASSVQKAKMIVISRPDRRAPIAQDYLLRTRDPGPGARSSLHRSAVRVQTETEATAGTSLSLLANTMDNASDNQRRFFKMNSKKWITGVAVLAVSASLAIAAPQEARAMGGRHGHRGFMSAKLAAKLNLPAS